MEAVYGQRFLALSEGADVLLRDACRWIGTIANATAASPRLFLAGDVDRQHGATMFTPEGFEMIREFERFRAVRCKYFAEMDASMKSEGWPPPVGSFRSRVFAGDSKCRCEWRERSLQVALSIHGALNQGTELQTPAAPRPRSRRAVERVTPERRKYSLRPLRKA